MYHKKPFLYDRMKKRRKKSPEGVAVCEKSYVPEMGVFILSPGLASTAAQPLAQPEVSGKPPAKCSASSLILALFISFPLP